MLAKTSYILKQTCSWKVQICLSKYDLFVDHKHYEINFAARNMWTTEMLMCDAITNQRFAVYLSLSLLIFYVPQFSIKTLLL